MRAIDAGILICTECHELNRQEEDCDEQTCTRCGALVHARRPNSLTRTWALLITAAILYIPANFLPIMQLNLLGQSSEDTVWSGVVGLFDTGMQGVAAVVFLCSMGIPLLKLLCQLAVLLSIRWNIGRNYGLLLYRIYHHMKDWGMLEVYLMGVLVAIVKLADMASITIGLGLVCFVSLLMVQVLLEVVMSPHQIWQALSGEDDHAGD